MTKPLEGSPWAQELKREAWKIKKATGRKHAEILDEIAVREGYKNWMRLMDADKLRSAAWAKGSI